MHRPTLAARARRTAWLGALVLVSLSACDELRERVDIGSALPAPKAEPLAAGAAPPPSGTVREVLAVAPSTSHSAPPVSSAKVDTAPVAPKPAKAAGSQPAGGAEPAQALLPAPKAIECEVDADCGSGNVCVRPPDAAADWARECRPATVARPPGSPPQRVSLAANAPVVAPSCDLRKVDWKEHAYPDGIKLEAGQWQDPEAPSPFGMIVLFERVLAGDVTGDDKAEVIVVLNKSSKGYYATGLYAFSLDRECRVQPVDNVTLEFVMSPAARIRGRELVLAYDHFEDHVDETYRIVSGKLRSVKKT